MATEVATETPEVVMLNFAEVVPAETMIPAGTTTDGFELVSATLRSAAATPINETVPVDGSPPGSDAGKSVTELRTAGVMARLAVFAVPFKEAVMAAGVVAGTAWVGRFSVTERAPAGMAMVEGTVTDGSELERFTTAPPAG